MMLRSILFLLTSALSLPALAAQNTVTVPIHSKGASTFYIKGKLGNLAATDFMVDTGSGYMVINQDSLTQLQKDGQAVYVKEIRGILANGKKYVVPVWRIDSLTIADQCVLHNVEAAVFPGKTRQILGLTALKKAAPFSFSFEPPQMVFSHCTQSS